MKCKLFWAKNRRELEKMVNTWLAESHVSPVHVVFDTASIADDVGYVIECTLMVFYVPMEPLTNLR